MYPRKFLRCFYASNLDNKLCEYYNLEVKRLFNFVLVGRTTYSMMSMLMDSSYIFKHFIIKTSCVKNCFHEILFGYIYSIFYIVKVEIIHLLQY
jgi:hypothetical protein